MKWGVFLFIAYIFINLEPLHSEINALDWWAKYSAAIQYENVNQWDKALPAYLDAYQYDPSRGEPLRKIATYYRTNGQYNLSYLFASQGIRLQQREFVDDVYFYQFNEELSIVAYYTPFREEGFEAANWLILQRNVPWYVKEQAYKNILFYVHPLENAHLQQIVINLPQLYEGSDLHYNLMNPCIRKSGSGYQMVCRTVNFVYDHGMYKMIDGNPDVFVRTRNFLVTLSESFQVNSQLEIIEDFPRFKIRTPTAGLEDCRQINDDWFVCTTWGVSTHEVPKIVLCKLGERQESLVEVDDFIPLKGPDPMRCEKNWLPIWVNSSLHLIYSYDPFIILKPDVRTGDCSEILKYQPLHDFSQFRGSAAPIALDDGYLLLVHEVVWQQERFYLHRFLFLDQNYQIIRASLPFFFHHLGVEYCCGMTINHENSHLVLSIGLEDKEGYLCFIDLNTIRSLLKPLQ